LLGLLSVMLGSRAGAQEPALPTLTTARELRALSPTEAARHYPVRLEAVTTLVETPRTVFLRDGTGATFIRQSKEVPPGLRAGQRILVEGETYPGLYLTGISPKKITVLGDEPIPPAVTLNYEQLMSGQFHYDRVEMRGIVRAATSIPECLVVKLATGDGTVDLYVLGDDLETAESLVDASVRVTGIAAGFINDRRQLVAPQLRVQALDDITVIEPAPSDPFAVAATPAAELLRFAPGGRAGHRVMVRGVVMHQERSAAVWLRDEAQGVRVRTTTTEEFAPGEVVEALGFPSMGKLNAELDDAILQRTGETAPLLPVIVTAKDLLTGKHDADLVRIDADVRDAVLDADRLTLTLQAGETVFSAYLRPYAADADLPARGAQVRLTGVCRIFETTQSGRGFSAKARNFDILLRSAADDIVILHRPPWWTTRRLAIAAGTLLALLLLAFIWVASLRRRVAIQTAIIRDKVTAEGAAGERERIAREFHDTLEQELVGLALRLDAASTKVSEPKARDLLEGARRLVQNIQSEVRGIVRNLRARILDEVPLPAAIASAVASLGQERAIKVHTEGEPRRLPGLTEHELLRIAQEATTNAVKHGQAQHIEIALAFAPEEVRLRVTDDGQGFDVEREGTKPGHFGLIGIRERVQKLGGRFELRSRPGAGATLEATVPLPQS
jgi:signal transduction histidine kinase